MDRQSCPKCKATKYSNPSLKLMVNVCGHALCENCLEVLFVRGSGPCPQCNLPLRRANFRYQLFEDTFVEKELDIRKKILRDFNLQEDDFEAEREYDDYLEMVETIIYNLTNDVDVEETKKRVEAYKKDNKDAIKKNRLRPRLEISQLDRIIEDEKLAGSQLNGIDSVDSGRRAYVESNSSKAEVNYPSFVADWPSAVDHNGPELPISVEASFDNTSELNSSAHCQKLVEEMVSRLPEDYVCGGYTARIGVARLLTDSYSDLYLGVPSHLDNSLDTLMDIV